jgi:hypothetical protein
MVNNNNDTIFMMKTKPSNPVAFTLAWSGLVYYLENVQI